MGDAAGFRGCEGVCCGGCVLRRSRLVMRELWGSTHEGRRAEILAWCPEISLLLDVEEQDWV